MGIGMERDLNLGHVNGELISLNSALWIMGDDNAPSCESDCLRNGSSGDMGADL